MFARNNYNSFLDKFESPRFGGPAEKTRSNSILEDMITTVQDYVLSG